MSPTREPRTRRARKTRVSVRVGEVLSRLLITVGGIGTIAAVVLMFVFLVAVVFPLFSGARIEEPRSAPLDGERAVKLLADEQSTMAALLGADGTVVVHRLADGSVLERLEPFGSGGAPTAWSFAPSGGSYTFDVERLLLGEAAQVVGAGALTVGGHSVALGFADGTVRTGVAGFASTFPRPESLPEALRKLAPGEEAPYAGGVLQCTGEGNFRWQFFALQLGAAAPSAHPSPVRLLAHSPVDDGGALVAWHEDGSFAFVEVESKVDWMTDEITLETEEAELPTDDVRELGMPGWLMLSGTGDHAFAIWADGRMARWNVAFPDRARIVETADLVSEPGARVTAATFLVGKTTLMIGDSLGRVRGWFCIKPEDAGTADGAVLELAHELQPADSPVTALATAPRSRVVASGHADGSVRLSYMTTADSLGRSVAPSGQPIEELELVPREEGLVAAGGGRLTYWELDLRYPEASLAAFFRPVWYEGYLAPGHTWQSEGATDDFEPKFGFLPLVFGTIKATVYSMLFGAPLALLAALYTSEFLSRKLRSSVKSIIEMMASLPSVVLGFLAGVVIAPFAASVLPATLALLLTLPASLLLGAYLWQLLPSGKGVAWSGWQRLFCMFLALPVGIFAATLLGPLFERLLFAGSLELWLDGQIGSAFGGWMLTLFPLSALLVFLFFARVVNPWIRSRSASWERRRSALVDLLKFGLGGAATIVLALALSWSLDLASLDPRGSIFGTYDSRNALVVGFVMGFAIIPIIYTLADDALTGVPEHLRRASLGAGATPWQTAVRVVIPTAMSGLFSAVMIGLGRAVGETMIVLMAVGNTPIMDWNIFNGFRTLSANIAVEMPEAVQNSTHYRTLFFAALVLFAMTFVLNTVAEIVRLRYRRRAVQL